MGKTNRHLTGTATYIRSRMGDKALESLFSDIWYHYYPRLRVFVRRMFAQPEDVDDAVQEAMLKAYHHLAAYRPNCAFSTWIYTIARNHCLDRLRKEHVRIRLTADRHTIEFESPYPSPEAAALRSESVNVAAALIKSLSSEDQQIAFLRFFEEMPFNQISKALGVPVGTLKYRIHHIRRKLRDKRDESNA
jgi:RNA polymerase sigma-70 factor (ECF subfamily)